METAEIARKMLDLYQTEDDWSQYSMVGRKNGRDVYCLLGGRMIVQYGELGMKTTDIILHDFADDEYLQTLAAIIREQYPELRAIVGSDKSWNDLSVIYIFNDEHAEFPDIRTVLEKAAAG